MSEPASLAQANQANQPNYTSGYCASDLSKITITPYTYPYVVYNPSPTQTQMQLTDMDKLVLDSMIQNDETIETMIYIFGTKYFSNLGPADKYLKYKQLRELIEIYVNGE